jgi:hypothetical protein
VSEEKNAVGAARWEFWRMAIAIEANEKRDAKEGGEIDDSEQRINIPTIAAANAPRR